MVRFDRWFSLMVTVIVIAWLFRDTFVRVSVIEQPVGAHEQEHKTLAWPKAS